MGKYTLGQLIEQYNQKCGVSKCETVAGINIYKQFMPSRNVGTDTSGYLVVPEGYFAFNLMHVGRDEKIPVALNDTGEDVIVSSAYFVFKVINEKIIKKEYLFILMNSHEFDRYAWFCTDSSVRGNLDWNRFCEIEVDLPLIPVQEKFVAVYNAMKANQEAYEKGLEDLKLTCDAYIEDLRRKMPTTEIGEYIELLNNNNKDYSVKKIMGVSADSLFIETKAKMSGIDTAKYTIVSKNDFAYNPSRINIGSIALFKGKKCAVSPMYVVFRVKDPIKLFPEYLMMWLSRKEFHRYTWFYAAGSVRDTFDYSLMCEVKIPIPDIKVQQAIVDIYNAYIMRREINERLKAQIKDLCPILIKGSLEEMVV